VIALPGGVRVLIATRPVDFRKGMDGLAALVKEHLRADPYSGAVFVFRARRADRVKLIVWDGTGLCLLAKRLEKGRFAAVYERSDESGAKLTLSELALFIEGSEAIGRAPLSPPLLRVADLSPRWGKEIVKNDRV